MKRLAYHIPFIGKVLRRLDAALQIIEDEWGGDRKEALEMVDVAAGIIPETPRPEIPITPYQVKVDWMRHNAKMSEILAEYDEMDKACRENGDQDFGKIPVFESYSFEVKESDWKTDEDGRRYFENPATGKRRYAGAPNQHVQFTVIPKP